MKNRTINEDFLFDYFSGNLSDKEINSLSEWLDEKKENRHMFSELKKAFIEISVSYTGKVNVDDLYKSFTDRIAKFENIVSQEKNRRILVLQKNITRYAAIFVLMLSIGVISYLIGNKTMSITDGGFVEIEVPYGGKSTVILPDGSKVWLNAGSKMKYNRNFDVTSREVFIEGEAFFDVKKRKHPLNVHTSHFDIQVLGTIFNIKSYPDENLIETTLVEGSIKINRKESNKAIYLKSHEKFTYIKPEAREKIKRVESENSETGKKSMPVEDIQSLTSPAKEITIAQNVNTLESTSWVEGDLIFNKELLEHLLKKLERKYDVKFYYESNELKNYSYSGTLRDFPLEQVLKALQFTSPINYKINEKTVILSYNKKFKSN